jgi:hypothetical protein
MTKTTYYEVVNVRKRGDRVSEVEEVVFATPHRREAQVLKDWLNSDLSLEERLHQEFRFVSRPLSANGDGSTKAGSRPSFAR